MATFEELYRKLVKESIEKKEAPQILSEYDPHHLDCLLYPEKYAAVIHLGNCECPPGGPTKCSESCIFDAIEKDKDGVIRIDKEKCVGCYACIDNCDSQKLTASRDILPALNAMRKAKGPVYALIAPAFLGQFSNDVTPGKLRTAFKKLGFDGMIEVALFADILTLKEALEFDKNILTESDFQLTSCCCPIWIGMIRKIYNELIPHVPGAVSPMVLLDVPLKRFTQMLLLYLLDLVLLKKRKQKKRTLQMQ